MCHEKLLYGCPEGIPLAEEKDIENIYVADRRKYCQRPVIISKWSKYHHGNPVQEDNRG
jgi:hypothetical protein